MLLESLQSGKNVYHCPYDEGDDEDIVKYIHSFISNYKDTIRKNNQRLSTLSNMEDQEGDVECRDQGFTRPVVLVLAPFRNSAFELINSLIKISTIKTVQSRKRFMAEFGPGDEEQDQDNGDVSSAYEQANHDMKEDFQDHHIDYAGDYNVNSTDEEDASLAGDSEDNFSDKPSVLYDEKKLPESPFKGNIDDCFRLGVHLGSRSISLYEKFYGSDLIIASPLSLRILIGSRGDTSHKHDHDFLSSIRLVVILKADVINMQNWDHLLHVHEHINLIPTKNYSCDFSRIHPLLLDGKGSELRQTIISTRYATPEINAFWRALSKEIPGSSIVTGSSVDHSMVPLGTSGAKLVLNFFPNGPGSTIDAISHFDGEVLSAIARMKGKSPSQRICIYVPSYLDFVQIKAKLEDRGDISFRAISDYSQNNEIVGARSSFFNRHTRLLLLSERLLYFKRLILRGIEQLIFFGPPTDPSLYDHLVHHCMSVHGSNPMGPDAPYISMYANLPEDALALERLVGPCPMAAHYGSSSTMNKMLVER